jgi:hypothetical protein
MLYVTYRDHKGQPHSVACYSLEIANKVIATLAGDHSDAQITQREPGIGVTKFTADWVLRATIPNVILSWSDEYGIADRLRCAAMQLQQDHPEISVEEFSTAAVALGYNPATARRCWAYVRAQ